MTPTSTTILATITVDGRRHAFASIGEIVAFVVRISGEYGQAIIGRKAAQRRERDAAIRLGQVLAELRPQVAHGDWIKLYTGLGLHKKQVKSCLHLGALAGADGRMVPQKLDGFRADRLARMPFAARQWWTKHPLFTEPAEELGHNQVCSILGERPLPGLKAGELDRVPEKTLNVHRNGDQMPPFAGHDELCLEQGLQGAAAPCNAADGDLDGDADGDEDDDLIDDASLAGGGGGGGQTAPVMARTVAPAPAPTPTPTLTPTQKQLELAVEYGLASTARAEMERVVARLMAGELKVSPEQLARFAAGVHKAVTDLETAGDAATGAMPTAPAGREPEVPSRA